MNKIDKGPPEPPAPKAVPTPRRGAFPTPKLEIDAAKPFVTEIDETDDRPGQKLAPSTDIDGAEEH